MPKLPRDEIAKVTRAELPVHRLPVEGRWLVEKAINNLLAQGFRIISPQGKDITESLIQEAVEVARGRAGQE